MSQSFHVVRCASCNQFQNHIVKKSSKWICKLCWTKQSLQQVFGTGPSIDCRKLVQQLNFTQGEIEEKVKEVKIAQLDREIEVEEDQESRKDLGIETTGTTFSIPEVGNYVRSSQQLIAIGSLRVVPKSRSRWTKYEDEDQN